MQKRPFEKQLIPRWNLTSWNLLQLAEKFTTGKEKIYLCKTPFVNTVLVHLDSTTEIPPHYEDHHTLFYIIEGTGTIQIGQEQIPVNQGMLVYSPKEKLRGISSENYLLILGIQEPH